MRDSQDLIAHLQDFCGFLAALRDVRAEVLSAPMAEGKWSLQEVIAHILAYDESFLQSAVLPIENGMPPHIADLEDSQSFNERAAAMGRKLTKAQLLERAALARGQLVDHLQRLPAEAFRTRQEGRADEDLAGFLDRAFVSHDRTHIEQMQRYLKSRA